MNKIFFLLTSLLILAGCSSTEPQPRAGSSSSVSIKTKTAPVSAAPLKVAGAAPATAAVRQAYLQNHPELPDEIKQALLGQKLATGMTPEQVTLVWGSPAQATRLLGISGERDEWTYADGREAKFQLGLLYEWK